MTFYQKIVKLSKNRILNMNLEAGFEFIIFLIFFGFTNYLMMLKRYENDLRKRHNLQRNKILSLYPKGTFISI